MIGDVKINQNRFWTYLHKHQSKGMRGEKLLIIDTDYGIPTILLRASCHNNVGTSIVQQTGRYRTPINNQHPDNTWCIYAARMDTHGQSKLL